MTHRIASNPIHWPQWVAALTIIAMVLAFTPGWAPAQEIIANYGLPKTAITRNEARLFFSMKLGIWPNGAPVQVYVLPDDHPLHREFCTQVLGLYPYQLRRVWDRQVFSGTGQSPVTISSEAELIERTAASPGAVSYAATPPDNPRVRVLTVK